MVNVVEMDYVWLGVGDQFANTVRRIEGMNQGKCGLDLGKLASINSIILASSKIIRILACKIAFINHGKINHLIPIRFEIVPLLKHDCLRTTIAVKELIGN